MRGFKFPTRNGPVAPAAAGMESQPLDCQGSPRLEFLTAGHLISFVPWLVLKDVGELFPMKMVC